MVNIWPSKEQAPGIMTPAICFLCGAYTDAARLFCKSCRGDFARIEQSCPRCGRQVAHGGLVCPSCSAHPPRYDRLIAPFHYTYPVSLLIKLLKYNNKIEISEELGRALADVIRACGHSLPEAIVPVPLHPLRAMRRGYNQAREIAVALAVQLQLPVATGLVRRVRHTQPQFNLGPVERRRNVRGAFRITHRPRYRSVAIVDDIVTTGTTVNELARALRQAGVKTIEVWAGARTD